MKIEGTRFGSIEYDPEIVIQFAAGMVGFPGARRFLLLPQGTSTTVAWLQCLDDAELALPVISAHAFQTRYPDVDLQPLIERAGIASPDQSLSIMAVVCAPESGPPTVNLVAPIIVNVTTHQGAQVLLEGTSFSAHEELRAPPPPAPPQQTTRETAVAAP